MRILAVTPYRFPEGGGLERYAHETLTRLSERGHEVEQLAFDRAGRPLAMEPSNVSIHLRRPRWVLGNTPIDPAFARFVEERITTFKPDVVVGHTPVPFPAEMAYRAAARNSVPFVTTFHAGRLRGSNLVLDAVARLDERTLQRQMLEGSSRLIGVSPFVVGHALRGFKEKTRIVPPGVDHGRFRPDAQDPVDPGTVLFVGPLDRAYRWKGVDDLWTAFRTLHGARPGARLVLVGDGDRAQTLKRRAAREDLPVRFAGRLSEPRLIREYRRANVVVLPSRTDAESFGMVLAEANACGRPVVASDVGGVSSIVRHGENGLLVPPHDPPRLAAAIEMLLDDPDLADRMGANGRRRIRSHHDWDRLTEATERVLVEAAAGKERHADPPLAR